MKNDSGLHELTNYMTEKNNTYLKKDIGVPKFLCVSWINHNLPTSCPDFEQQKFIQYWKNVSRTLGEL